MIQSTNIEKVIIGPPLFSVIGGYLMGFVMLFIILYFYLPEKKRLGRRGRS